MRPAAEETRMLRLQGRRTGGEALEQDAGSGTGPRDIQAAPEGPGKVQQEPHNRRILLSVSFV